MEHSLLRRGGECTVLQRALYQALCNLSGRTLYTLRRQLASLPESARVDADTVLAAEAAILARIAGRAPLIRWRARLIG